MRLLKNWRTWHRRKRVQLGAALIVIAGYISQSPDLLVQAWNLIPADLRGLLPTWLATSIGIAIFGLSIGAQLLRRRKQRRREEGESHAQP